MNPQVSEAISVEVGHPAPFRDEELDSVVNLGVGHAHDIAGLERCRSLRSLVLSGYGASELPDFSEFASLASLTVTDSDVQEIGSLATAPSLLMVRVVRDFVSDVSVLLTCSGLLSIDVTGNPLSDVSFREVLPELRAKGVTVKASEEREWSLTRALHDAGLPFAYYRHGDRHRLSRPGLSRTDTPEAGHVGVTPEELERLLATSPEDVEALFDDPTRLAGWS